MQARSQTDPRWYAPDRDLIWAFPRLISRALHSLTDLSPDEVESVGKTAKELARLINEIRDAKLQPETIQSRLQALDQTALAHIHKAFFYGLFGELWHWCGLIAPAPGDRHQPLDMSELANVVEQFARASRPSSGGADVKAP